MDIDINTDIIDHFQKYNFFAVRNFLMTRNFVFIELTKILKKSIKRPNFCDRAFKLASELDLNMEFILDYLKSNHLQFNLVIYHPYVKIVTDYQQYEQGMFLKIQPDLDEKEAVNIVRMLKNEYKNPIFRPSRVKWRKQHGLKKEHLQIYTKVEKQLPQSIKLSRETTNFVGLPKELIKKDKFRVLEYTFEMVRGQIYGNEYSEKQTKYINNAYYKVVERYNLPTLKNLRNLQQIITP